MYACVCVCMLFTVFVTFFHVYSIARRMYSAVFSSSRFCLMSKDTVMSVDACDACDASHKIRLILFSLNFQFEKRSVNTNWA